MALNCACGKPPAKHDECARIDCPHRVPGTSLWFDSPYDAPLGMKHDGTGWDRFYRGQRKPPKPGEPS